MQGPGCQAGLTRGDGAGSLAWQRTWNAPQQFVRDEARDVAVAPDGSVYVTGALRDASDSEDLFVIKFSPDGAQQWFKRWGADGVFEAGQAIGPA